MDGSRLLPVALTVLALVSAGAAGAAKAAGAAEQAYEIRLHRPDKPGMRFKLAISGAARQEASSETNGRQRPPAEQIFGVELAGVAEVLAVNEHGSPTKIRYELERCVRVEDDREDVLLPRGSRLVAEAGDKETVFRLEEGELKPEQIAALHLIISLRSDPTTADDLFGTEASQKPGATWPVNAKAMAKLYERYGMQIAEEAIDGLVTFEGIERHDGEEYLKLKAEVKIGGYRMELPASWNLPRGLDFKSGSRQSTSTFLVPVEASASHGMGSYTDMASVVYEGRVRRQEMRITHVASRIVHLSTRPLPEQATP